MVRTPSTISPSEIADRHVDSSGVRPARHPNDDLSRSPVSVRISSPSSLIDNDILMTDWRRQGCRLKIRLDDAEGKCWNDAECL